MGRKSQKRNDRRSRGTGGRRSDRLGLDRVADRLQDRADLPAQEDEGDDRDDRDQSEDQRVLRETLAILVAADGFRRAKIEVGEERHTWCLLKDEYPPPV